MLREEQLGKFSTKATLSDSEKNQFLEEWINQKTAIDESKSFELQMLKEEQRKQDELWKDKVMKPFGLYLLIKSSSENPYIKKISDSGIIMDSGGIHKNPDTGEMDMLERAMKYAIVEEAGPDVRHVKKGDEILFQPTREMPAPFKGIGYTLLNEGAVLAIIGNENDFKDRFHDGIRTI